MKRILPIQVLLVFLALTISGFDRHFTGYFSEDVKVMLQTHDLTGHQAVPTQACDNHEDISLRYADKVLPEPTEGSPVHFRPYHLILIPSAPLSMWQPPEKV